VFLLDNVTFVVTIGLSFNKGRAFMQVAVREAKAKFSRYGELAHQGNVVVVCKNGKPWFDLVPHQSPRRRTKPLPGVHPLISDAESVRQLSPEDISGWM
jgi:antitoxin (DNA-binding transcriptional repressor) of toxin-antitoxin stability system